MKYIATLFLVLPLFLFFACDQPAESTTNAAAQAVSTPVAKGTGDAAAIALAEKVMAANGGQEAWNNTRYIRWNFFGSRIHTWDRKTDDLVIEGLKDNFLIKMNLRNDKGTVNFQGIEYSQPDTLVKYLQMGREMYNNDSYWLLMPFKLRDPGVHLKYLGQKAFRGLQNAELMELTFDNVGDTPDNKYIIYLHPENHRVIQWEFFASRSDEKPRFATPWSKYDKYGNIWLSSSKGENYVLTDIQVDDPALAEYFK